MKINGVQIHNIVVNFELTDDELSDISIALGNTTIAANTAEEAKAAQTLTTFSKMVNDMLERIEESTDAPISKRS